ncbi:MAG: TonB family protein [Opitutaceae bacterium]|jgi:protein TonB
MRAETIISSVISASLITGALLGFNGHPQVTKKVSARADDGLIQIEMPNLPPESPETPKTEDLPPEDEAVPVTYAPPSLVDIPTITPDATFIQQIAPPPPPGIEQVKSVMTIPPARPTGIGQGLDRIFDLSQLDQIPLARLRQQPIYPVAMRQRGLMGEVNIGFIVDTNGDVRDPYVISASQPEFEIAALQAISKWKFRPGRRSGRNVSTRMTEDIAFELE